MLNPQSRDFTEENKIEGFNMLSVVLLTQNASSPLYQPPHNVMSSIPQKISREIIVVHYKLSNTLVGNEEQSELTRDANNRIRHIRTEGEFASAVKRGVEQSHGQFILIMDADQPYSEEVIPELISELIQNPNSIIVVSRFVEGAQAQSMPIAHNALRKGARVIAKYGLKVKNVEDPMSTCFAFSRHIVKDIIFEGKGKDALLELLVKINNNRDITVKEIPIKQKETTTTRKVNFSRVLNYSQAVWDLYRYGRTSKRLNESDIAQQKKHRSILFLSKAGRFFTVGASGLLVNYAASFLMTALIPNIWYIYATLFGIILSITSNFLLNKIWTFEDRDFSPKHFIRQYSLFMVLCTLGAVIQLSLVYLFVEYSHIQYAVSLVMAVAVASLSNFLLNKKITFGEKIWE